MDFLFVLFQSGLSLELMLKASYWGWEVDGAEQTRLLSCIYVQLGALHHSKERAAPAARPIRPAPSARTGRGILASATAQGRLLSGRKWVSAGTNLLPVFLFFPFLSNGKQSEQFRRMRDINLSAAIYTVLVSTVSKCLKYVFAA